LCEEKCHVEISSSFSGLEKLDAEEDMNSAWGAIREHKQFQPKRVLGYYELKKLNTQFNAITGNKPNHTCKKNKWG
jgi:hypothetical protein